MLIKSSKWEKIQKKSFQEQYKPLQETIKTGTEKGYDFNDFSQDLFGALYQVKPEFPEQEQVTSGNNWAKQALDELKQLREYSDIRKQGTVCDSFQSGLGSTLLAKHFAESLPKQEQPNPDELQKKIDVYKDWIEQNKGHPKEQACQDTIQDLQTQQNESLQAWEANKVDPQTVRIALRKGLQQAQEEIKEIEGQVLSFGYGSSPGQDGFNSAEEKLEIAKMLQEKPKLKEIAELAGRFKREARRIQSNKKNPGPDEITDIEIGSELSRLVPSEIMKLGHPLTKKLFYKGYMENTLIQYKLESQEKKVKGPIVVCVDVSGSMKGNCEVWSKSIALALCRIAVDSKRDFEIIYFSDEVNRVDKFSGKIDPKTLLDSIGYFSGGGTNFKLPLNEALIDIDHASRNSQLKDADIIFITDGQSSLDDVVVKDINACKKRLGISIFSICIGEYAEVLEKVSDKVYHLKDLTDDKEVKETIFSI